jgi:proteasome lid subunit RPN8/RPN11
MAAIEWQAGSPPAPEARSLAAHPAARGQRLPPAAASSGAPLVLVCQAAWQAIDGHLAGDLRHEQGGVLAGQPYVDLASGQMFVEVGAVAPALGAEGSPVHLQFTAEAWDYMAALLAAEHPELMVVGWYHSHPGLGVFMSGTDRATQRSFYTQPWHLAVVVDPVSGESAWFAGEQCEPVPAGNVVYYQEQAAVAGGRGQTEMAKPASDAAFQPAVPSRVAVRRVRVPPWRAGLALGLLLLAGYRVWRLARQCRGAGGGRR